MPLMNDATNDAGSARVYQDFAPIGVETIVVREAPSTVVRRTCDEVRTWGFAPQVNMLLPYRRVSPEPHLGDPQHVCSISIR